MSYYKQQDNYTIQIFLTLDKCRTELICSNCCDKNKLIDEVEKIILDYNNAVKTMHVQDKIATLEVAKQFYRKIQNIIQNDLLIEKTFNPYSELKQKIQDTSIELDRQNEIIKKMLIKRHQKN